MSEDKPGDAAAREEHEAEWEALDAYLRDEDDGEQDYARRCAWADRVRELRDGCRRNRSALESAHDRLDTLSEILHPHAEVGVSLIDQARDLVAERDRLRAELDAEKARQDPC